MTSPMMNLQAELLLFYVSHCKEERLWEIVRSSTNQHELRNAYRQINIIKEYKIDIHNRLVTTIQSSPELLKLTKKVIADLESELQK